MKNVISLNLKGFKKQMELSNDSFKQTVYDCTIRKNTLHNTKNPKQKDTLIYNESTTATTTTHCNWGTVVIYKEQLCYNRIREVLRIAISDLHNTQKKLFLSNLAENSIFCWCANAKFTSKLYGISNQQRRSGELHVYTCEIVLLFLEQYDMDLHAYTPVILNSFTQLMSSMLLNFSSR